MASTEPTIPETSAPPHSAGLQSEHITGDISREQRIQNRRSRVEAKRLDAGSQPRGRGTFPPINTKMPQPNNRRRMSIMPPTGLGGPPEMVFNVPLAVTTQANQNYSQITISNQRLDQTRTSVEQEVSNVKVATVTRESQRRTTEAASLIQLRARQIQDADRVLALNREIESRWTVLLPKQDDTHKPILDPYEFTERAAEQTKASFDLLAIKTELQQAYQAQTQAHDESYVREIKRHASDIDTFIERMRAQTRLYRSACANELQEIEEALLRERSDLILNTVKAEVNGLLKHRTELEIKYLEAHPSLAEEHMELMEDARMKETAHFNATKVKLEADVQVLEQQLQQMRATYQLNSEKLEYNFQVLKKRDEENSVTISAQKRRINRLNDNVNALKTKVIKQEEYYLKEFNQIAEDYKRMLEQFQWLRKKFRRFQSLDDHKYQDLWDMNEEEVVSMLRKIVKADQILWEMQLGSSWKCPEDFAKILQQNEEKLEAVKRKEKMVQEVISHRTSTTSLSHEEFEQLFRSDETSKVLDLLVAETANFLIEEKILKLITTLKPEEQKLMKVDGIFKALGIKTIKDVEVLETFFSSIDKTEHAVVGIDVTRAVRQFLEARQKGGMILTEAAKASLHELQSLDSFEGKDETQETQDRLEQWKHMRAAITPEKFAVWNTLHDSIQKYSALLTERCKRHEEVKEIHKQNLELKHILRDHLTKEYQLGMEIPPSRIMVGMLTRAKK